MANADDYDIQWRKVGDRAFIRYWPSSKGISISFILRCCIFGNTSKFIINWQRWHKIVIPIINILFFRSFLLDHCLDYLSNHLWEILCVLDFWIVPTSISLSSSKTTKTYLMLTDYWWWNIQVLCLFKSSAKTVVSDIWIEYSHWLVSPQIFWSFKHIC